MKPCYLLLSCSPVTWNHVTYCFLAALWHETMLLLSCTPVTNHLNSLKLWDHVTCTYCFLTAQWQTILTVSNYETMLLTAFLQPSDRPSYQSQNMRPCYLLLSCSPVTDLLTVSNYETMLLTAFLQPCDMRPCYLLLSCSPVTDHPNSLKLWDHVTYCFLAAPWQTTIPLGESHQTVNGLPFPPDPFTWTLNLLLTLRHDLRINHVVWQDLFAGVGQLSLAFSTDLYLTWKSSEEKCFDKRDKISIRMKLYVYKININFIVTKNFHLLPTGPSELLIIWRKKI